jgi:PAS domain S-box-containing protein
MKITMLHIDDTDYDLEITKIKLEKLNPDLNILSIESPGKALDMLEKNDFDCVLCDYQMPQMDGLAVLEAIRGSNKSLPFIFLTGQGNEELAVNALKSGATDYYVKGSELALYDRIDNSIRNHVRAARQKKNKQRAEVELRQNEAQLKQAQHIAKLGSWTFCLETRTFRCSDETIKIFGCETGNGKMSYEAFMSFIHPNDTDLLNSYFGKNAMKYEPFDIEHSVIQLNGTEKIVHHHGLFQANRDTESNQMVGTIQDITDHRIASRELLRKEGYIESLFNSIGDSIVFSKDGSRYLDKILEAVSDAVLTTDIEGRIARINNIGEQLSGMSAADIIGKNISEFFISPQKDQVTLRSDFAKVVKDSDKSRPIKGETLLVGSNGNSTLVEAKILPVGDQKGAYIGTVVVFHSQDNSPQN